VNEIIDSLGGLWIATIRSFGIMSGSIYPGMTVERRMSGEPQYRGDEGDAQAQEAIYQGQDEWRQAGGNRIVASKIMRKARHITGDCWSAVVLSLSDEEFERNKACFTLAHKISGNTLAYNGAVARRYGEDSYMQRHKGAVSREYRISYSNTIAELIEMHPQQRDKERQARAEVIAKINDMFHRGKERLENA